MDSTSVPSTQEHTPDITPSLAVLDNAQTLMRKKWRRGESGEDTPGQYSTLCGHLTPTQPRHENMSNGLHFECDPRGISKQYTCCNLREYKPLRSPVSARGPRLRW